MVEMAIGNCDRLVRLVNGILDFEAALSADKLHPESPLGGGRRDCCIAPPRRQSSRPLRRASSLHVDVAPVSALADDKQASSRC